MTPTGLIRKLRNSDMYIKHIFMEGGCHQFHLFLKYIFPDAKPYISDDKRHIVTKIGNEFYDIRGRIDDQFKDLYSPLEKQDIELVKEWSFRDNNLLKLSECEFCEEPFVYKPKK